LPIDQFVGLLVVFG